MTCAVADAEDSVPDASTSPLGYWIPLRSLTDYEYTFVPTYLTRNMTNQQCHC